MSKWNHDPPPELKKKEKEIFFVSTMGTIFSFFFFFFFFFFLHLRMILVFKDATENMALPAPIWHCWFQFDIGFEVISKVNSDGEVFEGKNGSEDWGGFLGKPEGVSKGVGGWEWL